jgi:glutathione peroxidase
MTQNRLVVVFLLALGGLGACREPAPEPRPEVSRAPGSSAPADSSAPRAETAAAPTASPKTTTTPPEAPVTSNSPQTAERTFHSFTVDGLDGKPRNLADYRGKVVLVVNTASECGYTPQYEGLQKLHESMSPRGFAVLGFPSNDFGGQEPGTAEEIQTFCSTKFHVTFPLFAKVQTKAGAGQAPLYAWLGKEGGKLPAWNFSKYLIGKDGKVIAFWPSKTTPQDPEVIAAIEKALAAS